ncbi:MAG: ribbon-helix-helix domain-containing protein [Spirirestis rafaelensis WJT71-NPBG6]|jgi:predicted transcriptional regulator|nr:ribbon-helix-helix domain-containing protein [Spirirestis rafaelensis WJT71-NPBG6]
MINGKPKTYNLPSATIQAVEKLARDQDRSSSSVVRAAIDLLIIANDNH